MKESREDKEYKGRDKVAGGSVHEQHINMGLVDGGLLEEIR